MRQIFKVFRQGIPKLTEVEISTQIFEYAKWFLYFFLGELENGLMY